MPCNFGGDAHGYLGVILTAAEYSAATLINTPRFVDPLFPGDAAVISLNSTGPQISVIEEQLNKSLCQWTEYKNLTDTIIKLIQDGIEDMYLKGITDRNVSLANITTSSWTTIYLQLNTHHGLQSHLRYGTLLQ